LAQSPDDIEAISKLVPNRVVDIADAVPMCVLKHEVDQEKIKYLIVQEITKASLMMNVVNNINTPQIQFTAETIMEKYPAESIEDVILCLRRGSQGYYGSVYHQLDTSVIMGWMEKHIEEKAVYTERNNQTAKEHEKNQAVDYEAFKARIEKKRLEQLERDKKEVEMKRQMAKDYLESNSRMFTVEITNDKDEVIHTIENVRATSQEKANEVVSVAIKQGDIKI